MSRPPFTHAATAGRRTSPPDVWQSTGAQTALATQFAVADDYLATARTEVGRMTGADTHELFVSCDPGQALRQQFEHLQPDFIAVHDVGTSAARKLLVGIAAASGRTIQKLVIRRQGYGTALATMEFVELPTADHAVLRMYITDADADTTARHALARTLLGFSRMGVLLVADLPSHAVQAALKPIREAMASGPWPNRQLLLLPLAPASSCSAEAIELAAGTNVNVRATPQVIRPADAWNFISASWSGLGDASTGATEAPAVLLKLRRSGPSVSGLVAGPRQTNPLTMRPIPMLPGAPSRRATLPAGDRLERYLQQLEQMTGMIGCSLFESANGQEIGRAGAASGGAPLALQGMQLWAAMRTAGRGLGFGDTLLPDAAITLGEHHLLLREVPRHPGLVLQAIFDKTAANLILVRLQIGRMDGLLFDESPTTP